MLTENDVKELDKLRSLVIKELGKITTKGDMTPVEIKNSTDAVCLLMKLEELQNGGEESIYGASRRTTYPNRSVSFKRMRNPSTGRYMDYENGYSGHSIHDRMIAALENLMDSAESNYEKDTIANGIKMIRQYEP